VLAASAFLKAGDPAQFAATLEAQQVLDNLAIATLGGDTVNWSAWSHAIITAELLLGVGAVIAAATSSNRARTVAAVLVALCFLAFAIYALLVLRIGNPLAGCGCSGEAAEGAVATWRFVAARSIAAVSLIGVLLATTRLR
jgi:hypothetical protein